MSTGEQITQKLSELNELCRDYLGEHDTARQEGADSASGGRYRAVNKLRCYVVRGLPALNVKGAIPGLPNFNDVKRYFTAERTPL